MNQAEPMALPWQGRWVPHALLDVGRLCNISCSGCYNGLSGGFKPLVKLEEELSHLFRARRLQAISLVGGEPSIHPQIERVVALVASRGLKVALLTNGVTLTADKLQSLRQAGLNIVLLHIEAGQKRHDLPADAEPARWQNLRATKARLVAQTGMAVGLSHIARRSQLNETANLVREVLTSTHLDFLLITGFRDFTRFGDVTGDIASGLRMKPTVIDRTTRDAHHDEVAMTDLLPVMRGMSLTPFARVGSGHSQQTARWLIYLAAAGQAADGSPAWSSLRAGWSDRILSRAIRWIIGRHVFLHIPSRRQFHLQLLLNSLSGGGNHALKLARSTERNGGKLRDKHIVLQEGPIVHGDGTVETCCDCPDAVWQNGALVPVCLADRLSGASWSN